MELAYRLTAVVPTGIPGFDSVHGHRENGVDLVEERPGSGKASMALQFLMDARLLASKTVDER